MRKPGCQVLEPKPRLCHPLTRTFPKPQHCLFCPQTRPTPPHLTSAMAENILAAACESETRKAAKRMRLEIYQSSQVRTHAVDMQGVSPTGSSHWPSYLDLQRGCTGRWEGSTVGGAERMGSAGCQEIGGECWGDLSLRIADLWKEG